MTESVTILLGRACSGDAAATDDLMRAVYLELRSVARRLMEGERSAHTLQPTAVVHEAYLRLVESSDQTWESRAHFFGAAANAIRRILIDHARRRSRLKRGGDAERADVEPDSLSTPHSDDHLLAVEEALQQFARIDPTKARLVELRFFAGLDVREAARVLGKSASTVAREWRLARAWFQDRLEPRAHVA